jgi:hypothetical protein
MAEPITIIIGKGQQSDGTAPEDQLAQSARKEPGKPSIQQQAVNSALINAGKQVMMSGVRVYGNITGDYATVNLINATMSIGADVLMIAKGGWVGAIAVGAKYAISFANSFVEQKHNEFEFSLGMQRSGGVFDGNSLYLNGSRGTNG